MADCSLPLVRARFSTRFLRVFCEFSAGFLRAKSGRLGMAAAVLCWVTGRYRATADGNAARNRTLFFGRKSMGCLSWGD